MNRTGPAPTTVRDRYTIAVLAVCAYIVAEWLFLMTGPMSRTVLDWSDRLSVLWTAILVLTVPVLITQSVIELLGTWARLPDIVRLLTPAAVLTFGALLLFDNFTYTLFHLSLASLTTGARVLYAAAFIFVLLRVAQMFRATGTWLRVIAVVLVVLSAAVFVVRLEDSAESPIVARQGAAARRPNILMIAADGVLAEHTSLYGYPRKTTPFLDRLATRSLIAENAFSNASHTYSAVGSMLTGRLPLEVNLINSGTPLRGADSFRHLPRILRRLGYSSAQVTMRKYGDAIDANFILGFDIVNGRPGEDTIGERLVEWLGPGLAVDGMFIRILEERAEERLRALTLRGVAENPYLEATGRTLHDAKRVADAKRLVGTLREPWFIHVHLVGPHCCAAAWPGRAENPAVIDQYDRAIRLADEQMAEVAGAIEAEGKLDRTLIIVSSDHDAMHRALDRVPLVLAFPDGAHRGRIRSNVQLVDVAPTVLDHLGVEAPAWMAGRSLLTQPRPDHRRPIFVLNRLKGDFGGNRAHAVKGVESVAVIVCDRVYELELGSDRLHEGRVAGHTAPCAENDVPAGGAAKAMLMRHLAATGFLRND